MNPVEDFHHQEWGRWFAWYPVRLIENDKWVWLRPVMRTFQHYGNLGEQFVDTHYLSVTEFIARKLQS